MSLVLSDGLWAAVFALVAPSPSSIDSPERTWTSSGAYSKFHQLRLVCKQFRAIFNQHARLSSHLVVFEQLASGLQSSPQSWLQNASSTVSTLEAQYDGPPVEELIVALAHSLRSLSIRSSQPPLHLLPALTNLTSCCICMTDHGVWDLKALQTLPLLSDLHLQGQVVFVNLSVLPHLTKLRLADAQVSSYEFEEDGGEGDDIGDGECQFFHGLHTLFITDTYWAGSHAKGLCAFDTLECLYLHDSTVTAAEEANTVRTSGVGDHLQLPDGLAVLTRLTELHLDCGNIHSDYMSFDWLYTLVALQDLHLVCPYNSDGVTISRHFTMLQTLKTLYLSNSEDAGPSTCISLEFDWGALQSLQRLSICNGSFSFCSNIVSLTQLEHLQYIHFCDCIPANLSSVEQLAVLAYKLSLHCPVIQLLMNGRSFRAIAA